MLLLNRGLRAKFQVVTAALALMAVSEPGTLSAGEIVRFETPPIQPSTFRMKRAKAQGKTLEPTPGIQLSGVVSRPDGVGPFPAIIVLPESTEARASYDGWAEFLTENGYVSLVVDSLTSRGAELLRDDLPMDLQMDAQAAHGFLSDLTYVDPQRIGLMGFGVSANFVQRSLDASYDPGGETVAFFAGVVLYPNCDPGMSMETRLLILAGAEDKVMSIATCQAMVDYNAAGEAPIKMQIYSGATHFFDNPDYSRDPAVRRDNWKEPMAFAQNVYDLDAHAEAKGAIAEFLRAEK